MRNDLVMEFNDEGYLIYCDSFPGAFVRGRTRDEALSKFPQEIKQYCKWAGIQIANYNLEDKIVQEKKSSLRICDADSDVIFETEKEPLSEDEYIKLKLLGIKSAQDFLCMYESIPNKDITALDERKTFYGAIPRTAKEMYEHTNNVTSYYVGEIKVALNNISNIANNRKNAFKAIESMDGYLANPVYRGSYGEEWSLRKVLRRFIWHDRIHAKAMYRMAKRLWDKETIADPFFFGT